jgi:hypothetical protein
MDKTPAPQGWDAFQWFQYLMTRNGETAELDSRWAQLHEKASGGVCVLRGDDFYFAQWTVVVVLLCCVVVESCVVQPGKHRRGSPMNCSVGQM